MNLEQEVIDMFLQVCRGICNDKGYSKLSDSDQRKEVKEIILRSFNENGHDLGKVLQLLDKFDIAVFRYLDTYVMNRGGRPLHWPDYHEDSIRVEMLYELYL
jgi:hypothetical protein